MMAELEARLDLPLPPTLPAGRASAILCAGACFHYGEAIESLEIEVDGVRHQPKAVRMPRPDIMRAARESVDAMAQPGSGGLPQGDLEARAYCSGYWGIVPVQGTSGGARIEVELAARLADGGELTSRLGEIEVLADDDARVWLDRPVHKQATVDGTPNGLISVCMATFEPDLDLFQVQIESLRAQTDGRWVCVISDDCSTVERFDEIKRVIADDPRFVVSRSDTRLGFYRNFERALTMVPSDAHLVALSDQDDRWHPTKLETLRSALGQAQLVFSDQRLVETDGRVLRDSLWKGRRNNFTNLASQLIAGTIGGAAMLFRRELLDVALPFPEAPGVLFHDHWLGMVAMATGEVAFIDKPLYDYVQHGGAVLGHVAGGSPKAGRGVVRSRLLGARVRGPARLDRWRAAYFYGFVSRSVMVEALLARCAGKLSRSKRRVLERFVASERSPVAFAWLAIRPLRCAVGLNETLASELDLVRGILWRWLVTIRMMSPSAGIRMSCDASLPDPAIFEQRRLRAWRSKV